LLYWPNRKTRAGTKTTTKNYMKKVDKTLCAIQTSGLANPMVRELKQQTTGLIDFASVDYTTQVIAIYTAEKRNFVYLNRIYIL
jgi:hypothetical protein